MKIGITGGIGSGKSYVCNILKDRGIPVYSTDDEAKRLMAESPIIKEQLCNLLGNEAYNADGTLNKPIIAQFLFASTENAKKINAIVHPVVKEDFRKWAEKQSADIVSQESAILFESGFDDTVDKTIEVYAPKDVRLTRAMKRDNATLQQIEARMSQQMDEEEKRQRADFCIINDGTANLETQINEILKLK